MNPKDDEPLETKELMAFLPEGAVATVAVICAPFWAFSLAHRGHLVAGIIWWAGAWVSGYLAYHSYMKGDRGGIFAAIGAVILLVLGTGKLTHQF